MNKIAMLDPFEGNNPNHVLVNEYLPGQGIMVMTILDLNNVINF